jgi:hypothetical protein
VRRCLSQNSQAGRQADEGEASPSDDEGRLLQSASLQRGERRRKAVVRRKTPPGKGQDSYFRRLEELGDLGADNFTTLLLRQM